MFLRWIPALLLILLFGCTEAQYPTPTGSANSSAHQSGENDYALVFFLDPNGAPCRTQDAILQGMAEELRGKVDLRYVQTTVPSDLDTFYAFGIRGLPALLLTDPSGKEIRRLPPGVKSAEEIRRLLQAIPGR